ncbi:MAG: pantoate--beta-alanine ligase, partial [Gammaproteobacteria bacterium]|nr:pantoate--beta-alanine ligase [Gammaproteobacteria bacterium]
LFQILKELAKSLRNGRRDYQRLELEALRKLSAIGMRPDYVAVRCANTLSLPEETTGEFVVLAAAWLGRARLIDNVEVKINS